MWKDYEELEHSLSMAELNATLAAKRDADYQQQKFHAALQGVDLDSQSGKPEDEEPKTLQDIANKMAAKETGTSTSDIVTLRGAEAMSAGIGIGNGLDYEIVE